MKEKAFNELGISHHPLNDIDVIGVWLEFFSRHCMSMVGLQPSSSMSTGCVVPLRGDWLRVGWQRVISQAEMPRIFRH